MMPASMRSNWPARTKEVALASEYAVSRCRDLLHRYNPQIKRASCLTRSAVARPPLPGGSSTHVPCHVSSSAAVKSWGGRLPRGEQRHVEQDHATDSRVELVRRQLDSSHRRVDHYFRYPQELGHQWRVHKRRAQDGEPDLRAARHVQIRVSPGIPHRYRAVWRAPRVVETACKDGADGEGAACSSDQQKEGLSRLDGTRVTVAYEKRGGRKNEKKENRPQAKNDPAEDRAQGEGVDDRFSKGYSVALGVKHNAVPDDLPHAGGEGGVAGRLGHLLHNVGGVVPPPKVHRLPRSFALVAGCEERGARAHYDIRDATQRPLAGGSRIADVEREPMGAVGAHAKGKTGLVQRRCQTLDSGSHHRSRCPEDGDGGQRALGNVSQRCIPNGVDRTVHAGGAAQRATGAG
eukprot:scaffold19709_cov101-Isochrysis_galbana.AAC.1